MIDIQLLEAMFEAIRNDSKWDTDGELLWGYFFMDTDPKKLGLLAESLTQDEYHLVDIHEADDQSTHVLHVERVEKHTPQTLHARNIQLGKIAEAFGVNSYDGMDVGPVPKQ